MDSVMPLVKLKQHMEWRCERAALTRFSQETAPPADIDLLTLNFSGLHATGFWIKEEAAQPSASLQPRLARSPFDRGGPAAHQRNRIRTNAAVHKHPAAGCAPSPR